MWHNHTTDREPRLDGKQYALPHGKVVGGSSAINGLVHVRGTALDYNTWKQQGADGWGYEDVLPYFKKHEHHHLGETEYHGADGPLGIEPARWKNPLADAFIDAAAETLGLRRNTDFQRSGRGRYRLLGPGNLERAALVHATRLHRAKPWPSESAPRHLGAVHEGRVRGRGGARASLSAGLGVPSRPDQPRGHSGRRRAPDTSVAPDIRRRTGRAA
jgi:choline dehydrogenase-like flavoprotein